MTAALQIAFYISSDMMSSKVLDDNGEIKEYFAAAYFVDIIRKLIYNSDSNME